MSKKTRKRAKRTKTRRVNPKFDMEQFLLDAGVLIKLDPKKDKKIWEDRIREMKAMGEKVDENEIEIIMSKKWYDEIKNNELNGGNDEL